MFALLGRFALPVSSISESACEAVHSYAVLATAGGFALSPAG
ncbi:MAG: hypothetical protein ACRDRH_10270 [Pseudonocardia sp.]